MSRKPIQVPDELKAKVEELKGLMHKKTEYEVIEQLVSYHDRKGTHLVVTGAVREEFKAVKSKLRFRDDEQLVNFLLYHYQNSPTLSKETFDMYINAPRYGA
ncbi:hypothetical protein [Brevibacillus sp. SYSU BS000544]|uniref:hypothetical protein n=1 Tax=Brevibacillus sp. SYSU BS000544 TaxID=3416443 RepID=UPI003CE4793F